MIDRKVRFDRGRIVAVDEGGVPTASARGAGLTSCGGWGWGATAPERCTGPGRRRARTAAGWARDNGRMTRRVDAYRGLSQPSRLRIMHELLVTPGQSLADLAAVTGLHENTLRDHLHVLESEGFVVRRTEHRGTRGRPRDIFDPSGPETPSPVAARRVEDAKRHGDMLRKVLMHTTATDETVAHQLDALYEHLDDVGLDPQMDEKTLTVDLAPCAFHDLVDGQLTVLCHVHAELIRGVLHQAGGPVEVDQLLPLVTAHHCHLALKIAAPQTPAAE